MYIKCVLLGVRFVETDFCQVFMFYEMFLCKVRSGRWPSRTVAVWGLVEFASEDDFCTAASLRSGGTSCGNSKGSPRLKKKSKKCSIFTSCRFCHYQGNKD